MRVSSFLDCLIARALLGGSSHSARNAGIRRLRSGEPFLPYPPVFCVRQRPEFAVLRGDSGRWTKTLSTRGAGRGERAVALASSVMDWGTVRTAR